MVKIMRTVKVVINCGKRFCGKCRFMNTIGDDDHCNLYSTYLKYDYKIGGTVRHKTCLISEVTK